MSAIRPNVLSIAGFDPSAGAGLLADVKTFEQSGVYGFGVVSALTWQNDLSFNKAEWLTEDKIISQVEVLLQRFSVQYIKIGLLENMEVLVIILRWLHEHIENPVIIYDPVLKASAGYDFYEPNQLLLDDIMQLVFCITPNIPEAEKLFGKENMHLRLESWSNKTNIYLKGGHGDGDLLTDTLFTGGSTFNFIHRTLPHGAKHGSGCVLSAALTAQLALGNELQAACSLATNYTYQFLASNDTLLGYHNPDK